MAIVLAPGAWKLNNSTVLRTTLDCVHGSGPASQAAPSSSAVAIEQHLQLQLPIRQQRPLQPF